MNYYQQEKKDVLDQLNVDKSGLSQQEVKRRQETEGFNEIEKEKKEIRIGVIFQLL